MRQVPGWARDFRKDGKKEFSLKGLIGLGLTIGKIVCIQQARRDGDLEWDRLDAEIPPLEG